MKTSTKIYIGCLVVLAIILLSRVRGAVTAYARPPEKLQGLPNLVYDLPPPIITLPTGSEPQAFFDWLGEQCGCDSLVSVEPIVIDTVRYTRNEPSYQYVPAITFDYVSPLKGAANLTQNIMPPAPIVYHAATPTFWWGWSGMRRVIYTSDSFVLPISSQDQGSINRAATLESRTWADVTPGRNALTPITVIQFNAQRYVLDSSRSTGL